MMNIRIFRQWNEIIVSGASFILIGLLIWMTVREKNTTIRSYSRMIYISSFFDGLFCFLSLLTTMSCVMDRDVIIMISESFLVGSIPPNYEFILNGLHYFNIGLGSAIVPVDFLYRYFLICRKRSLSFVELLGAVLLCFVLITITALLFSLSFYINSQDSQKLRQYEGVLLKDGDLWMLAGENDSLKLPTIIGAHSSDPLFLATMLFAGLVVTAAYVLSGILAWLVYNELNKSVHLMSEKTRRLQRSMTLVLICKALTPFLLATFPAVGVLISLAFQLQIKHLGMILILLTVYIPLINPLSTLLLLKNYRIRLLNMLRRRPENKISSMQLNSAISTSRVQQNRN